MALIACPSCQNQISDKAVKCPKCDANLVKEVPKPEPVTVKEIANKVVTQELKANTSNLTPPLPARPTRYAQYKIIHIAEGGCGTILLGAAGLPLQKIESILNNEAANGWQVVFQVIESKRFLLFWTREALIVTLGKE